MRVTLKLAAAALGWAISFGWATPSRAAESYEVEFRGAPPELSGKLRQISELAADKRTVPTLALIGRLAARDADAIKQALQASGYYAGAAGFSIATADDGGKHRIVFDIAPGALFRISEYVLAYSDATGEYRPSSPAELGLNLSGAADGASLRDAQQSVLIALWAKGYPAARIVGRRAEARMEAGSAKARFEFQSGLKSTFGELNVSGAERTKTSYLQKLKTWEDGEIYDRSRLVAFRDRLAEIGIFSGVDVEAGAPDESGVADVLLEVEERPRRTVGVGASFSTAEGPGGRSFLEYRNMFGAAERARAELSATEVEQSLVFNLDKPLPLFPGSVFGEFRFRNETTDAFNARSVQLSAGFARRWLRDRLETRGGVAFETSGIDSLEGETRTYFLSLPVSAVWNTEDDPLKLSRGIRAALSVSPYLGSSNFTQGELSARGRFNFGADDRFTLAARSRLGATVGATFDDLPINKRFFPGGGASVRGFDFQAAGPVTEDGTPIGGRSVIEGAVEARARVTSSIQLATFLDAGSASPSAFPDFSGPYLLGGGGGVRYLTPIGPIRADFAVPLNPRPTDSSFQFYISLGQPF